MSSSHSPYLIEAEERSLAQFFRRRLSNREDTADAVQETFLRFLSIPTMAAIENPQAYLFAIAKSVAQATMVRRKRDGRLFLDNAEILAIADDTPLPDRIVDARQVLERMARAIEALPTRCQQVFVLSRLHGLPNGEIAIQLGISRNMVEKHIIKALLHCREVRDAAA